MISEQAEYPTPQIIEGPHFEERTRSDGGNRLIGIHITQPELIGRLLVAQGVPVEEVPSWEFHTNVVPGMKYGDKQAAFNVSAFSEYMDWLARKTKKRYSSHFKPHIASALAAATYGVSPTAKESATLSAKDRVNTGIVFGAAGTSGALLSDFIFFGETQPGYFGRSLATGVAVGSFMMLLRIRQEGVRQYHQLNTSLDDNGLRSELTNGVLPTYFKDLSTAPRQVFSDQLAD